MEDQVTNEKNLDVKKEILEWLFCLVVAVLLYLIINYFVGTVSGIKQTSMTPTYVEGEKILIKRNVIFHEDLKYGDVITFVAPNEDDVASNMKKENIDGRLIQGVDALAKYDDRNFIESFVFNFIGIGKKSYIKRVIGLEGDHIQINKDGTVLRNGEALVEEYIKDGITSQNGIYINVIVPENSIFVMGDNRLGSLDSRVLGCIPLNKIDGYVITKVWPINKIGK